MNQTESENVRLSLQSKSIGEDTHTLRSLDWDRSRFDIEFGLKNGTTYNSYIIQGEKNVLIDTSHLKFNEIWFDELKQTIDPSNVDYLIVSHTEPDHSGLIGNLLILNNNIEIIASKVAIKFLKDQLHMPFKYREVKTGDELDLGKNKLSGVHHKFQFISAPNLHWPDTIFSYDQGTNILFTCDAFGLHFCSNELFDQDASILAEDFRFYYDCLMGPNARSVLQAIKKMNELEEVKLIGVGHGPVLKYNVPLWIDNYQEWSSKRSKGNSYAAVCYISQYGFCDRLSQSISHGIGKTDAQVQLIDLQATDEQELSALINEANAVVMPSWPCDGNQALQNSIGTVLACLKKDQWIGIYEPYGGNEEPIDVVSEKLRRLGQKEAFKPLRVREEPNSSIYQQFEEAGTDLGQVMNRKKNLKNTKSLDSDISKALGKISSGLYIVTAKQSEKKSERTGAMVASWVSQASFEPPGLTVAVAKDRAIEALMQIGDRFVLNILEEDNYLDLFRHFLKRFSPGADRFEGVSCIHDIAKGGPVLSDSLAFLGCIVKQKIETNDHWVIYALVEEGNVSKIGSRTAIHHRRVGTNY